MKIYKKQLLLKRFFCIISSCIFVIMLNFTVSADCSHSGGEATCTSMAVCEKCGATYGEKNPNKHIATEIRGYIAPSCNTNGYTGDVYCIICSEFVEHGSPIEINGEHLHINWKVTKPATVDEMGITESPCERCGMVLSQKIPKLTEDITSQTKQKKDNSVFFIILIAVCVIIGLSLWLYNKRRSLSKE